MPLIDLDEPAVGDEDFDHIAEAKAQLAHIESTVPVFDFTTAIAVAQAHAFVSIAQSLDALAFTAEADGIELTELVGTDFLIGSNEAVVPRPASMNDYYREG